MNAMILAAGRGTRLGELGLRSPKILLDVGGVPLLARHLRYLEREGVDRVVVNAHHLADQVESFLTAYKGQLDVALVVEPELLGTAGGVRNALPLLGHDPFAVLYGDVMIQEPLAPLFETFYRVDAAALLTVYEAPRTVGKGVVELARDGRVLGFLEKQQEGPGLVNAGLYVLAPQLVVEVASGVQLDFGVDVLPAAVERGQRVFAHRLEAPVIDVGTPEALEAARAAVSKESNRPSRQLTRRNRAVDATDTSRRAGEPSFSVVVCAYSNERWDDLTKAVRSIRDQSYPASEIILVIDHNPALLERARRSLPGATVVPNSQMRGLGGARNSGVAASTGSVVAFLDDDAVASRGWLEEFARAYADPDVIGLGGSIRPAWAAGRPAWFPAEFDWVVGCTYEGMPLEPAVVRNLIGCNMSYRREACEALGGFRLGYGCDETEFCIRIGRRWPEKVLRYVPAAQVEHRVPPDRGRWRHFRSRCYFEGGSKAVVSWLLSSREGLASERNHAFRTLPRGVWRGICDTVVRGDPWGVARAAAIAAGLAFTGAGYAVGRQTAKRQARRRGWDEDARLAGVDDEASEREGVMAGAPDRHRFGRARSPEVLKPADGVTSEARPDRMLETTREWSPQMLDLSVVVPVRNAERILDDCLASVARARPREIIVVDGMSSDGTIEVAQKYPVTILSDDGRGLPAARLLGVEAAASDLVALVDADVVVPDGALERLLAEYRAGGYSALQAGLHSVSGRGYWGRALANHHRSGRSKDWFGVVATIIDRATLLEHGFDHDFLSGEDMELRWRLRRAGAKLGVSRDVVVEHRFEDTFDFARSQWLADGHGLGRLIRKQGWKAAFLLALPAAAAVRGIALSLARRQLGWVPYYACYAGYNYVGILAELGGRRRGASSAQSAGSA